MNDIFWANFRLSFNNQKSEVEGRSTYRMARSVIVKSFWCGGRLPILCWLCIKSFIDHGHTFVLYCYDEIDVPSGVLVRDAREIMPESRIFFYETGPGASSVAGFTDLFRYKLLLKEGGWWVDTDVLCLSPELPAKDNAFGWEAEGSIGSAILKFPRNSPLVEQLYLAAEQTIESKYNKLEWGEIGPRLITRLIKEHGFEDQALSTSVFYPTHWDEFEFVLRPEKLGYVTRRAQNSLLFHLWNEMFRRASVDPESLPLEGSYLSLMLNKHGVPSRVTQTPS